MFKIVIDPGHGGNDRANVGPTGYVEADGTLKMAKMLREELQAVNQFEVKLTRETDTTVSLTDRGKMGAGADLFLAIHSNAWNKMTRGTEVFYSVDLPADKPFAEKLVAAVAETLEIPNRGAKLRESVKYPGEDYYTVIDVAQDSGAKHVMLIETAFHDNAQDEQLLKNDANLRKIMQAAARVICGWFGVAYSPIGIEERLAKALADKNWITDTGYWVKVFQGKEPAKPEYLKILFSRITGVK